MIVALWMLSIAIATTMLTIIVITAVAMRVMDGNAHTYGGEVTEHAEHRDRKHLDRAQPEIKTLFGLRRDTKAQCEYMVVNICV